MDYETLSRGVQSVPIELRIKSLKGRIQAELDYIKKEINRTQTRTDYDKDERMFILNDRLSYCKEVSEIPINDDKDFEFVEWLFNGGRYRTSEEIEKKSKEFQRRAEEERIKKIRSSPEYLKGYHPFLVFIFTFLGIPFIPCLILGLKELPDEFVDCVTTTFVGTAVALAYGFIPLLIVAGIVTLIYTKFHSDVFDVPMDEEVLGAVAGATITGCATYYFKTKSNEQKAVSNTV